MHLFICFHPGTLAYFIAFIISQHRIMLAWGITEQDVACDQAFDPLRPSGLLQSNGTRRALVFSPERDRGFALGNTLIAFLTSYHDAMRSGRELYLAPGIGPTERLRNAFVIGVPWAGDDGSVGGALMRRSDGNAPRISVLAGNRGGDGGIEYLSAGLGSAATDQVPMVARSRLRSYHFVRSSLFVECYYTATPCPRPRRFNLNPAKIPALPKFSEGSKDGGGSGSNMLAAPTEFCAETHALNRLVLGPSPQLQRLGRDLAAEGNWNGSASRLEALLSSTSSGKPTAARHPHEGQHPVWDAALHIRTGLEFMERGEDERGEAQVKLQLKMHTLNSLCINLPYFLPRFQGGCDKGLAQ